MTTSIKTNMNIESLLDDSIVSENSSPFINSEFEPPLRMSPLTPNEINSILQTNQPSLNELFIDLEPETPLNGTQIRFKLVDYLLDNNQPTNYGIKTAVTFKFNCFFDDDKIYPVSERFFKNPGEPVSGRLKTFCSDLFGAFGLKRAHLEDLLGLEGTAVITYTLSKDGETNWPHLSEFKSLS